MKVRFFYLLSLVLLAGVLLSACVPGGSAPGAGTTPTGTEPPLPPTGSTDTPTVPDGQDPTETPGDGLETFKAWLSENITSRNYAELQKRMTDPFWIGGWRSEVQSYTPTDAIEQVKAYFGEGDIQFFQTDDPVSFLGGEDPRAYLNPEVKNPEIVLAQGLGDASQDGAILILSQNPDGSYAWYGMLTVPGGFVASVPPVSEAEPFKAWLSENIASRNYEELQKLMGDPFWFSMWQSEGGPETPENAIRLLRQFFGENEIEFLPPGDPAAILGFDPLTVISPEVKGPQVLLVRNVGTEGKDGAVLYIAQNPDSSYYWYGLMIVRGGF